jgi:hypothetical protein
MSNYNDLFSRDNFGDAGTVPSVGDYYQSPDIIPFQAGTLTWPQVQTTYNGPDLGQPIVNQGVNNIYVRCLNNNPSAASSGTVQLFCPPAGLFLNPPWPQVMSAAGQGAVNLVDSTGSTSIASLALALSQSAFVLTSLNPNQHYCMISMISTPTNPMSVPATFTSNAALAAWVQNNPSVAWRNVTIIPNGSTQAFRTYGFGNGNLTGGYFYFTFTAFAGKNFAAGTGITAQCTDAANPIQWTGTLPAPDSQGNQLISFVTWVNAGYTGTIQISITSPGGALPPASWLQISYSGSPTSDDALHRYVVRWTKVAPVHETLGPQPFFASLIPLGECNMVVASS